MKKCLLLLLGLILIGILSYFCFLKKSPNIQNNLISKTETLYTQKGVEGINVKIDGKNLKATRVLILTGIVSSEDEKNHALLIAENIEGVTGVDNQIVIKEETTLTHPSPIAQVTLIQTKEKEKNSKTFKLESQPVSIDTTKNKSKQKLSTIVGISKKNSSMAISCQKQFTKLLSKNKINFEYNKTKIKSNSYALLGKLVETVKSCPGVNISIEGHTDSDGSKKYNQILSEKRAEAVQAYLIKKGISKNRLSAIGYGEAKPIANNSTKAGRKINRRIELNIKGVK